MIVRNVTSIILLGIIISFYGFIVFAYFATGSFESSFDDFPFSHDLFSITTIVFLVILKLLVTKIIVIKFRLKYVLLSLALLIFQIIIISLNIIFECGTELVVIGFPLIFYLPTLTLDLLLLIYISFRKNIFPKIYLTLPITFYLLIVITVASFGIFGKVVRTSSSDFCGCGGDAYQGILTPDKEYFGCAGG